ncbi:hypothetical protein ACQ4PT_036502 [Festuca glaucescens]
MVMSGVPTVSGLEAAFVVHGEWSSLWPIPTSITMFAFNLKVDSNTDGLVDFEEFVAATLHVHQLVEHDTEKWKSLSQAAFDKFDVDGDGYITSDELRMNTGLKGSIDPLLEEADIDKDGKISLDEFRRLLKTASISSRNTTPQRVLKS